MDFTIDKPGELRFTPKVHRRVRNSSSFGKMSTAARRANQKPEPREASCKGRRTLVYS